jgi:hypothetical protein
MTTHPAAILLFVVVLLAGAATPACGFYLPGVAPADFRRVRLRPPPHIIPSRPVWFLIV